MRTSRLRKFLPLLFAMVTSLAAIAGEVTIPERPVPARLVNDFAGVLNNPEELEKKLEHFSDSTSNQIVVVTVPDLGDYEAWDFAARLGDKWGVGSKEHDNGLVILIKPKTPDSRGIVNISPGKGLEGVLPDAFCNTIINHDMLTVLKAGGSYDRALQKALDIIMPVCTGEYSKEQYEKDEDEETAIMGFICLLIIGLYFYIRHRKNKRGSRSYRSGSSLGNRSSSSIWSRSSSSSSSSSWGGSFGGGSFGGGGATGSW